jgi:2-oxoglutarate dehydrogenase E2 component (dihydrolipoamide succinyltransferase)
MLSENKLSADAVSGTGKDGRVTKGDVINALSQPKPAAPAAVPAARAALPTVAAPHSVDLGDRPEQHVPMSRLRARIAERKRANRSLSSLPGRHRENATPHIAAQQLSTVGESCLRRT